MHGAPFDRVPVRHRIHGILGMFPAGPLVEAGHGFAIADLSTPSPAPLLVERYPRGWRPRTQVKEVGRGLGVLGDKRRLL